MYILIVTSLFRMDLELLPLESVEIISHLVPNETEVCFYVLINVFIDCSIVVHGKCLNNTLIVYMISLNSCQEAKFSSEIFISLLLQYYKCDFYFHEPQIVVINTLTECMQANFNESS